MIAPAKKLVLWPYQGCMTRRRSRLVSPTHHHRSWTLVVVTVHEVKEEGEFTAVFLVIISAFDPFG